MFAAVMASLLNRVLEVVRRDRRSGSQGSHAGGAVHGTRAERSGARVEGARAFRAASTRERSEPGQQSKCKKSGGPGWIRTNVVKHNGFTARSLWPLGYRPLRAPNLANRLPGGS